jgi:NAD(P)-dependent dehydrogenase (short-subunit alcohol dehydrogenase family)
MLGLSNGVDDHEPSEVKTMNMRRLENKTALVTGGGSGIGAAIVRRFVEEGARVCIVDRRKAPLEAVAKSLPKESVTTCLGDVSNATEVERMIRTALTLEGKLHILVNSAAINSSGAVTDVNPAQWGEVLGVNLTGPFLMMREAIPHMMKSGGGSIINIASLGGLRCPPTSVAYCTSKAGLIMLTQQAAVDYGPKGIRCNVVCPGWVRTPMSDEGLDRLAPLLNTDREGAYARVARDLPLGKAAKPEEIAPLCAYLASDESSFMTGAVLVIDGGSAVVDAGAMSLKG